MRSHLKRGQVTAFRSLSSFKCEPDVDKDSKELGLPTKFGAIFMLLFDCF
jgi:hypothetical protein